jgi:hypothetical protein
MPCGTAGVHSRVLGLRVMVGAPLLLVLSSGHWDTRPTRNGLLGETVATLGGVGPSLRWPRFKPAKKGGRCRWLT